MAMPIALMRVYVLECSFCFDRTDHCLVSKMPRQAARPATQRALSPGPSYYANLSEPLSIHVGPGVVLLFLVSGGVVVLEARHGYAWMAVRRRACGRATTTAAILTILLALGG